MRSPFQHPIAYTSTVPWVTLLHAIDDVLDTQAYGRRKVIHPLIKWNVAPAVRVCADFRHITILAPGSHRHRLGAVTYA